MSGLADEAQRLQDHMEQHYGVCLQASQWDAAIAALRQPATDAAAKRDGFISINKTLAAQREEAPDAGDMQGLVERLHDLVRNAYRAGAEDVHRAWVAGNGQSEADFGEAASDYVDGMELPDFPTAIQSLTAQLAETECARKAILTTAASVAWDLAAERGKVAELVQGLDMWVAYDDLDEAEFAGVHPMVAYSQAINNSRALIERMK